MRRYCRIALVAVIALALSGIPAVAQGRGVLVFAAASLKDALDDITAQYQRETGKQVRVSLAASSVLAKQIENGAPADIFISADLDWMDYLAKRNLIKPATRSNLLGNSLVLIAPKDGPAQIKIQPGFPLAQMLAGGKLSMADVATVPCGKYGGAERQGGRHFSAEHASTYHLSYGSDRRVEQSRRRRVSGLSQIGESEASVRKARLHASQAVSLAISAQRAS
jgi:hypothetical protein